MTESVTNRQCVYVFDNNFFFLQNTGDYSGGLFADRRREPVSGRDQIRETENNFVGAFAQVYILIKNKNKNKIVGAFARE